MSTLLLTPLDVNRPAIQIMIAKINAMNATTLDYHDFVLQSPTSVVNPNYDTSLVLGPTATSQWYNNLTVFYRRLDLATLFSTHLFVQTDGATTVHGVLSAINAAYGIYLTPSDVEDDDIVYHVVGDPTSSAVIPLIAKPGSVLFKGAVDVSLNYNNTQGVGTYDDEQTYYALVSDAGIDTVKAFNSQGIPLSAFQYLSGATINACTIHKLVQLPEGLLAIGPITYTPVNALGPLTPVSVKAVTTDNRGAITGTASGERFGTDYPLAYFPDVAHGFVYALDRTNALGITANRVHRYLLNGEYDATLNLVGLTDPVTNMAVAPNGDLFLSVNRGDGFEVHKRKADGTVDIAFSVITIGVENQSIGCNALSVSSSALFVKSSNNYAHTASYIPSVNGTPLWSADTVRSQSSYTPVLKFSLLGVLDATFKQLHQDRGNYALGVGTMLYAEENASLVLSDTFVSYIGSRISPVYGMPANAVFSLDITTGRVQDTAAEFIDSPVVWEHVYGTALNKTGEIAVWGTAHVLDAQGAGDANGVIALYSKRATPGGIFVTIVGSTIRDVFTRVA